MQTPYHVHISYAPADDASASSGSDEWLLRLSDALRSRVEELLGARIALTGIGDDASGAAPSGTSAIVCIVTDSFLRSEPGIENLRHFSHNASGSDRTIFVAMFDQLPIELLPSELHGCPKFDFSSLRPRPANGHAVALPNYGKDFWLAVDDLAFAIRDAFVNTSHGASKPAVFLAEASPDLSAERERLRREMQRHGFPVISVAAILDRSTFETLTQRELQRARVAIHFIGAERGVVPNGGDSSALELQYRVAAERAQTDRDFTQIIWMPQDRDLGEGGMESLVANIQQSAGAIGRSELVQTTLEDFKTIAIDALLRVERGADAIEQPTTTPAESGARLYLIHDRRDAEVVSTLSEHFGIRGFEVILPDLEGDHTQLRERHFHHLSTCDAALIYYGAVNEQWVRMKQQDLRKAAGYGRQKRMLAAVYVGRDANPSKQRFEATELLVIRHFGEFAPETIDPFVEQVRRAVTSKEQ